MRDAELTIATLNLEAGRELELVPELVRQAGDVDILLLQFSDWLDPCDTPELVLCVADMSATLHGRWPGERAAREGPDSPGA